MIACILFFQFFDSCTNDLILGTKLNQRAVEERSTEDVNESPAITTEEIIGKAHEANAKQNVKEFV
jgi:hypothetical protein